MGGKGELVNYERIRAVTDKERQDLKQAIALIVDNASKDKAITVIALVEEDDTGAGGTGGAG